MATKILEEGKLLHTKYTGKCKRCDCIFEFLDEDINRTPTGKIYSVYDPMKYSPCIDEVKMSIDCPWCGVRMIFGNYPLTKLSDSFENGAIKILEVLEKGV